MNREFLHVIDARVSLGSVPIVNGVSLSISARTCLALLGPSGCGKTTLLNVLAGALALERGRIVCDGTVLDDPLERCFVPMQQRMFTTVFQDFSLWPHMTVAENVAFGLRIAGQNKSQRQAQVREMLKKVRMTAYADRYPAALSGGQQQRVAIARALAVKPRLLLLDEPLSALDARLRAELRAELATILRQEGQTAVYVTHDQAEAFALGDQVALIREGKVVQCDTPEAIFRSPRTAFAAEFLGGSNVLSYIREGQRVQLEGIGLFPAWDNLQDRGKCFIRREALQVCEPQDGLPIGTCVANQFLGGYYEAVIGFPAGGQLIGRGTATLRPGGPACIRFDPAAVGLLENEP